MGINSTNKECKLTLLLLRFIFLCVMAISCVTFAQTTKSNNPSITSSGRISFYFQNIEIKTLLQLISKHSNLNFVISDTVKGNITLNLKNVTWRQALSTILKTQGLASRQVGNVMYISTIEDITSNETKQMQADDSIANLAPLKSAFIRLKYTNAADLANLLKGSQGTLLTGRGQVAVDTRTNTLIIRDTKQNLADVVPQIYRLDIPARQVLIEARIVNIDTSYEEQLGVKFGISNTRQLSGTLAGANQLAQGTSVANVVPLSDRLNFNVPASNITGNAPGSIGLALQHIGSVYLDLELSALEGERHAQIISRPRVVTSNQEKATIQTGEEIPYQEATSSGATSVVFKKAVLSMEITPQITPNNKIILKLKATEDSRGENITTGVGGPTIPAINTQEVQSNVLLNNNETIVIGGVYKVEKHNEIQRIPFFGSLPVIGFFFRHNGISNRRQELLIFITPRIITTHPILSDMTSSRLRHGPYKGERADEEQVGQ